MFALLCSGITCDSLIKASPGSSMKKVDPHILPPLVSYGCLLHHSAYHIKTPHGSFVISKSFIVVVSGYKKMQKMYLKELVTAMYAAEAIFTTN